MTFLLFFQHSSSRKKKEKTKNVSEKETDNHSKSSFKPMEFQKERSDTLKIISPLKEEEILFIY